MTTIPQLGPDEAVRVVEGGALLLDVREHDEWEAGHAPQARHLPMGEVLEQQASLPADRQIVVVCRGGHRSERVAEALITLGLEAVNLTGGMTAWLASGLPVVHDDGSQGTVA
jgi:rhodanese-related sulfurtransferase